MLQKLFDSRIIDGYSKKGGEGLLRDVINSSLVIMGARCGARLDGGCAWHKLKDKSEFVRVAKAVIKKSGRRIVFVPWGRGQWLEPLLLNLDACDPDDVKFMKTCRETCNSDITPTASAVMGRLLGYSCNYDGDAWDRRGFIELNVVVNNSHETLESIWLAGFGCGPSSKGRSKKEILNEALLKWSKCRDLAGEHIKSAYS